jgi:hypothetical protein
MATSPPLIRRLTLSVLLLLTLLFTQQGALLHELSHWHAPSKSVEVTAEAAGVDTDVCRDCLAFAQAGGLAQFDLPALPSHEGLSYHFLFEPARSVAEASTPTLRSRGPPLFV